jgi:hypothetical protein
MNPDGAGTNGGQAIVSMLNETAPDPRRQIRRIVAKLGPARTHALAQEALRIEAAGGQVIPDGRRRRTVGGIFFHLVKQQTGGRRTRSRRQRALSRLPLLTWATRMNVVRDALAQIRKRQRREDHAGRSARSRGGASQLRARGDGQYTRAKPAQRLARHPHNAHDLHRLHRS